MAAGAAGGLFGVCDGDSVQVWVDVPRGGGGRVVTSVFSVCVGANKPFLLLHLQTVHSLQLHFRHLLLHLTHLLLRVHNLVVHRGDVHEVDPVPAHAQDHVRQHPLRLTHRLFLHLHPTHRRDGRENQPRPLNHGKGVPQRKNYKCDDRVQNLCLTNRKNTNQRRGGDDAHADSLGNDVGGVE